jgi:hypothetical protein
VAKFADEKPEKIETISDRIIAKLDKEYPEYRDFQELVEEHRHEVDIIPYTILISTEENEYDMHCFNTADEVIDYIKTTLNEQSGWSVTHIFYNGNELEYEVNIILK